MTSLQQSPAWQALQQHYAEVKGLHMRELFAQNPQRFEDFSLTFNDILFDYSKNRITKKTISLLCELATECDLAGWRDKLFNGEKINHTEGRAVLHTALRDRSGKAVLVDGADVAPKIQAMQARMREIANAVRSREWRGITGQPITDVVNIGVGGSDLGPVMAYEALRPYAIHDLKMHFVSNVDESHIADTLEVIKPETTLFIVVSKSFTTQDTLVNARTARRWLVNGSSNPNKVLQHHMLAVTEKQAAAEGFGIPTQNILPLWDWVGGRYSLWSAVGLSVAIAVGMDYFEEMLEGAYALDEHFRHAPCEENIPMLMALLGIWYNNFFNAHTYAVLPYDQYLHRLPPYLRQQDMESNGKRITRSGEVVDYATGPAIFGQLGISGQHAFYQLMHQGTQIIPADILAPINRHHDIPEHHRLLLANVFAQTEAFMRGKTQEEAEAELKAEGVDAETMACLLPYKVFPGNKPTNTILYSKLTPKTLGALIAMYEHKVFVQGVIWGINSFDQWGVELGKQLAKQIMPELESITEINSHDASTNGLINYYKLLRDPMKNKD